MMTRSLVLLTSWSVSRLRYLELCFGLNFLVRRLDQGSAISEISHARSRLRLAIPWQFALSPFLFPNDHSPPSLLSTSLLTPPSLYTDFRFLNRSLWAPSRVPRARRSGTALTSRPASRTGQSAFVQPLGIHPCLDGLVRPIDASFFFLPLAHT